MFNRGQLYLLVSCGYNCSNDRIPHIYMYVVGDDTGGIGGVGVLQLVVQALVEAVEWEASVGPFVPATQRLTTEQYRSFDWGSVALTALAYTVVCHLAVRLQHEPAGPGVVLRLMLTHRQEVAALVPAKQRGPHC
jgi:hypothetical protein